MVVSSIDWRDQLRKLRRRGRIWRWPSGGVLDSALLAIADVLAWFEAQALRLLAEADPRTTCWLLPDWEASVGLPDGCTPLGASAQQRRNAVVGKLNEGAGGGPTASGNYYVELAAAYGFTITTQNTGTNTWQVNSPLPSGLVNSTCDCLCDDPLEAYGNGQLECMINRVKQAQTHVTFSYSG